MYKTQVSSFFGFPGCPPFEKFPLAGVRALYRGLMPTLLGILPHAGTSPLISTLLE